MKKEKQTLSRRGKLLFVVYIVFVSLFTVGLVPVHAE